MAKIELIATSTFGLEAVVKREVEKLGLEIVKVEDGKVTFTGDESAIVKSNLWLRCADRVHLKLGEFPVYSFEDLFQRTKSLPWQQWITEDGKFTVTGSSVKSKLYSVSDCQAIVKKAVVEKMKETYQTEWFEETGPDYTIKVSILKDIATLTIDTSGAGLHKRGYRVKNVPAPIKETLAAAMVQLSFWNPDRVLVDPFCGSGTIPIEAALIGRNIAPGLNRKFASEEWPSVPGELWKKERTSAYNAINNDIELKIYGYDIDRAAVDAAMENSEEAGVDDCIYFKTTPLSSFVARETHGVIVCNPPYGERIGEREELSIIYRDLKKIITREKTWSLYLLTSDSSFESQMDKKADKRRKLYNGRIQVDYYQYYGTRPPRKEK